MKAEHLLFRIAIATLLLCSLSLGGLDQSGNINAKNMTISDFNTLVPLSDAQDSFVDTGAPWTTSMEGGTEMAVYTEQAPPAADLEKLMPSAVLKSPPMYMYYNGNYLPWNDFSTTYPSNSPGLWIERAVRLDSLCHTAQGRMDKRADLRAACVSSQHVRDLSRRLCAELQPGNGPARLLQHLVLCRYIRTASQPVLHQ